jgi:hypothetical protein
MAGELVAQLDPGSFYRETSLGYDLVGVSGLTNLMRGASFQKINPGSASGTPAVAWEYYNCAFTIPANLTLTTGLTFFLILTDDGADATDLGKVVKFGFTVKRLNAAATTDLSASAGAEQTGTVTLQSTTGQVAIFSLAVANANLNSAAVGDLIGVRIRRMGGDAADTCNGRVVVVSGHVKNT